MTAGDCNHVNTSSLLQTAEEGDRTAQAWLGKYHLDGTEGFELNYAIALQWLQKAAAQGEDSALANIGYMYELGLGVQRDQATANDFYLKAAQQGNAEQQYRIACKYDAGTGGLPLDVKKAIEMYTSAANAGLAAAQNRLGYMYYRGIGVERDHEKAFIWFDKAAAAGNVDAQEYAVFMRSSRRGSVADEREVVEWLKRAAEGKNLYAKNELATRHDLGKGVELDRSLAAKLYREAAEQGLPVAQINLGMCYLLGSGVEKSKIDAYSWLQIGLLNRFRSLKHQILIAVLRAFMKKHEYIEAQKRTTEYLKTVRASNAPIS